MVKVEVIIMHSSARNVANYVHCYLIVQFIIKSYL